MHRNTKKGIVSTLLFLVVGVICVVLIGIIPVKKNSNIYECFVWEKGDYTYIITTGDKLERLHGSSIVLSSDCKPYLRNDIDGVYVATKNGKDWNKRDYSYGRKDCYEYFKIDTRGNCFTSSELIHLEKYMKELLYSLREV